MKFSSSERLWAMAIMEALIPPTEDERFPWSALDTGAVKVLEEMLFYLPPFTALGLRLAVMAVEMLGPRLGLKKNVRFSRLSLAEREECLARLSKKDTYVVRQLVLLLKSVACLAWCGDPRVRESLGHALPPKFVKRSAEG